MRKKALIPRKYKKIVKLLSLPWMNHEKIKKKLLKNVNWSELEQLFIMNDTQNTAQYNLLKLITKNSDCFPIELKRFAEEFYTYECFIKEIALELKNVINLLTNQGIIVIVLKGLAISKTVYPDPAMRQTSDIDILVDSSDIEKTKQCLSGIGFKTVINNQAMQYILYRSGKAVIASSHHIFPMIKNRLNPVLPEITIEVHHQVFTEFTVPFKDLLSRSIKVSVYGISFLSLGLADMFAAICVHHFWDVAYSPFDFRLKALCDVSACVHVMTISDWKTFLTIIREINQQYAAFYLLKAVKHVFNLKIPNSIMNQIKQKHPESLLRQIFFEPFVDNPRWHKLQWRYNLDERIFINEEKLIQEIKYIWHKKIGKKIMLKIPFLDYNHTVDSFKMNRQCIVHLGMTDNSQWSACGTNLFWCNNPFNVNQVSGEIFLLWNYKNLLVEFHVRDSNPIFGVPYNDDSVEITFYNTKNEEEKHYIVIPMDIKTKQPICFTRSKKGNLLPENKVEISSQISADGYIVFLSIPWQTIDIYPQYGKKIGADIFIFENDNQNINNSFNRAFAWASGGLGFFKINIFHGWFKLV